MFGMLHALGDLIFLQETLRRSSRRRSHLAVMGSTFSATSAPAFSLSAKIQVRG